LIAKANFHRPKGQPDNNSSARAFGSTAPFFTINYVRQIGSPSSAVISAKFLVAECLS